MAKGGKVQHWKHGWIPLTAWARAYSAGDTKTRPSPNKAAPPVKVASAIQKAQRERLAALPSKGGMAEATRKYGPMVEPQGSRRSLRNAASAMDAAAHDARRRERIGALRLQAPVRQRSLVPGGQLIDAMKNDGGFTYDPKKAELVKVGSVQGIAVARPGTETPVGKGDISREAFADAVADLIEARADDFANGAMLGGWYSEDRDQYMVEVTDLFPDRESAIKAGKERNQEGIFDLGTGDYISTGGTGDGQLALTVDGDAAAIMDSTFATQVQSPISSFSQQVSSSYVDPLDLDMNGNLHVASTGPGQPFWPEGVPAVKDVAVRNQADGDRLAEAWQVSGPLLERYAALEPSITPELEARAAAAGGEMQGLKHKLKERGSLTRKLYSKSPAKGLTPASYAPKLGDSLRYTMVTPPGDLASATQGVLDSYRAQGYTVDVENTWGIPNATYKGLNTNISKGGLTFEVQFHSPESLAAKNQQHSLYDIARSDKFTPEERAAANDQMERNMAALANPPGIEDVR